MILISGWKWTCLHENNVLKSLVCHSAFQPLSASALNNHTISPLCSHRGYFSFALFTDISTFYDPLLHVSVWSNLLQFDIVPAEEFSL